MLIKSLTPDWVRQSPEISIFPLFTQPVPVCSQPIQPNMPGMESRVPSTPHYPQKKSQEPIHIPLSQMRLAAS